MYSAYGTKWNGNAAANNGSLFVVQDGRIRRLSPLETERLMGFPDNYTDIKGVRKTNRYQATGNSWAVPVVQWIGERLFDVNNRISIIDFNTEQLVGVLNPITNDEFFLNFGKDTMINIDGERTLNVGAIPENSVFSSMENIVSSDVPEDIYISPVSCFGIVRRKRERNLKMNQRLEEVLLRISSEMDEEEIEKRSRIQRRGRYSDNNVAIDIKLVE